MASKLDKRVNLVVEESMYSAYTMAAEMLKMSFSKLVRNALKDFCRDNLSDAQKDKIREKTGVDFM